uniref:Uncharacterized protein n=1 Tax=Romanomermis culicivorax TaxID=13658 RepID=A0A915IY19_ROMCU
RASFAAQLKAATIDDPDAAAATAADVRDDNIESVEPALHVSLQKWEAANGAGGGSARRSNGGDATATTASAHDKTSRSQSATVIDRKCSKHIAWT